ncbi:sugar phosphate isomerase/epimerase family protein [Haloarcula onubensis]|uniref:Sugar phosphate isomerase/epimerase n=1 Tax=Haloarcula onubensis TaxID=2950539 RepID=A0ABU2FJZ5_9EURY|nr:sugar phosphate isomerase/epimerase [Halomicroarcula sp. S3CR25-11]MDS0281063.1 sugar phosphate isomerase/epimerase [Halomicroarcula sp. S3CR25-11]
MESDRRDRTGEAGGKQTTAGGPDGAETLRTDGGQGDADLLANTWMHSGGTTPFQGAHGHREWSPWPIARRAEMLNDAGFDAIGLIAPDIQHILDFEFGAEDRTQGLQQLDSVLRENDIDFVELEFLTEWVLPSDDPRRQEEQDARELLLEAADVLDANHVKIGNLNSYPVAMEDLQQRFAQISDEFAETDTEVGLEFFPVDPNVQTVPQALEATEQTDNGGLYLDLWHNVKLDVDFDNIRSLSGDDIVAVEFNDGYVDTRMSFLEETINLRKLPGEGEFPIESWVSAVRAGGFDGPWGLEILSEEFRRFEMADAYPRAFEAGAEYV